MWSFKSVERKKPQGHKLFDVRIFSEATAATRRIKVKDYTTLDAYPELILFEGWVDKQRYETQMEEKKTQTASVK